MIPEHWFRRKKTGSRAQTSTLERLVRVGCPAGLLGSVGEYSWGGYASTVFFIDPKEARIAMLMTQFLPSGYYPIRDEFRVLVYQAPVDGQARGHGDVDALYSM